METHKPLPEYFLPVAKEIVNAHLVATDGCHKIYLAMDEEEAEWFRENYEYVVEDTAEVMLTTVMEWFENSCSLRFVSAVRHNADDPNAGFTHLIEQGTVDEDGNLFDDEEYEEWVSEMEEGDNE
jgi:hypothetical protein